MTVDVIVPAAGKGSRMQAAKNKMFLEIYGVPILYRTLKQLEKSPLIQRILIVLKKGEKNDFQALLDQFGAIPKIMGIVYGGKERVDSVKNGLAFLEKNNASDIVMVHDGARPFFSPQLIENLVKGVNEIGAAVPVLPLEDTIRQKTGTSTSATVIDRNLLMRTQTPQAFRSEYIQSCFFAKNSSQEITDDISLIEIHGKPVTYIAGEKWNIKVTTPEDIQWSEFLLSNNPQLNTSAS